MTDRSTPTKVVVCGRSCPSAADGRSRSRSCCASAATIGSRPGSGTGTAATWPLRDSRTTCSKQTWSILCRGRMCGAFVCGAGAGPRILCANAGYQILRPPIRWSRVRSAHPPPPEASCPMVEGAFSAPATTRVLVSDGRGCVQRTRHHPSPRIRWSRVRFVPPGSCWLEVVPSEGSWSA